ncbi:hypothetical protein DFH27DRAFT_529248 [Peziza echinospora]|nr:hypothetical protein DFH27DRAFT_529248 [Peziza echinospora]
MQSAQLRARLAVVVAVVAVVTAGLSWGSMALVYDWRHMALGLERSLEGSDGGGGEGVLVGKGHDTVGWGQAGLVPSGEVVSIDSNVNNNAHISTVPSQPPSITSRAAATRAPIRTSSYLLGNLCNTLSCNLASSSVAGTVSLTNTSPCFLTVTPGWQQIWAFHGPATVSAPTSMYVHVALFSPTSAPIDPTLQDSSPSAPHIG